MSGFVLTLLKSYLKTYVNVVGVCMCLERPEEGVGLPAVGVMGVLSHLTRVLVTEPLQDQQAISPASVLTLNQHLLGQD